jgi:hypothetical protein
MNSLFENRAPATFPDHRPELLAPVGLVAIQISRLAERNAETVDERREFLVIWASGRPNASQCERQNCVKQCNPRRLLRVIGTRPHLYKPMPGLFRIVRRFTKAMESERLLRQATAIVRVRLHGPREFPHEREPRFAPQPSAVSRPHMKFQPGPELSRIELVFLPPDQGGLRFRMITYS